MSTKITIPVSIGELVDKITILEIKSGKMKSPSKRQLVVKELKQLQVKYNNLLKNKRVIAPGLSKLKADLTRLNLRLWKIEDRLRNMESVNNFADSFIRNARAVYKNNDKRAEIKNRINVLAGSEIQEVKEYSGYRK